MLSGLLGAWAASDRRAPTESILMSSITNEQNLSRPRRLRRTWHRARSASASARAASAVAAAAAITPSRSARPASRSAAAASRAAARAAVASAAAARASRSRRSRWACAPCQGVSLFVSGDAWRRLGEAAAPSGTARGQADTCPVGGCGGRCRGRPKLAGNLHTPPVLWKTIPTKRKQHQPPLRSSASARTRPLSASAAPSVGAVAAAVAARRGCRRTPRPPGGVRPRAPPQTRRSVLLLVQRSGCLAV